MQYINPQDWKEFEERYPGAYYFLLHRSLLGEKSALENEYNRALALDPRRRNWIINRLAELKDIKP